jgi:hypothetical protein
MSWAGLASNQTVSFNNLQNAVSTGVFVAKTSIPASNEQITKADADTYVYIDTSYSPYAAKSSNQLVVKSDLQTSLFSLSLGPGYDTIAATCNTPFTITQTGTYSGTLGVGTVVNGVSVSGDFDYFLILESYLGQDTLSTIGINDNGEVTYLEFYCPF